MVSAKILSETIADLNEQRLKNLDSANRLHYQSLNHPEVLLVDIKLAFFYIQLFLLILV